MSYYRKGDVVTLNSGGPKMTVTHGPDGNDYVCIWYNNENCIEKGTFHCDCLKGEKDEK